MARNVKITTKGDYNLKQLIRSSEKLDGRNVIVGPQGQRNRFLAKIHEYGIMITVTERMRAYLASQGLYLKSTTQFINIPERSFIRAGWDANKRQLLFRFESMAVDVAIGKTSEDAFLNEVGKMVSDVIKDYAKNLKNPANHPFTVQQKGFDDPLNETGRMVDSIYYEIE